MRHTMRNAMTRARSERGYTLVELIIVMIILLVIVGGLADGFASATKAEADQSNRASDQQNARQALERMRLDIHCALSAQPASPIVDASGNTTGYLLTLPQPNPDCPGVQPAGGTAAVQWCTVEETPTRYKLYRSLVDCTVPADATFQVDYVTQANIWPATTCTPGEYPTVGVDMPVNRNPVTRPGRTYELKDAIAIRNTLPYGSCS
jgi:prepilin-type N-terminal cleavage/methylation domain-containing protein